MKMTDQGLALIRRFEGFREAAYRDATGIWTVGYGHTAMAGPPAVAAGLTVNRAEAEAILARDVDRFARQVADCVTARLSDRQFSALVSFAYNVGMGNFRRSSVLRAVNAGDVVAVPRRLQLWTKAGGRVLPGLVARRAAEAELFLDDGATAAQPRLPEGSRVESVRGKPPYRSTTTLAAALSAAAGIASTVLGTAREAAGVFGGGATGLVAMAVIVAAALWIIRERHRKSVEEGV